MHRKQRLIIKVRNVIGDNYVLLALVTSLFIYSQIFCSLGSLTVFQRIRIICCYEDKPLPFI